MSAAKRFSKIRHLATSPLGSLIAAAEFEHRVSVWDLRTYTLVSEFDSILDFGGVRLAISGDDQWVACGAYTRHGIALHRSSKGDLVWQRRDLKKVQHLQFASDARSLYACFEGSAARRLRIRDGDELERFRDLTEVFEDLDGARVLQYGRHRMRCVAEGNKTTRLPTKSSGLLHAVFASSTVVISEACGPLSSYRIKDASLRWELRPPKDSHYLRLAWCPSRGVLVGTRIQFSPTWKAFLESIDFESGKILRSDQLGEGVSEAEFAMSGALLITSLGEIIHTATARTIAVLPFPFGT